ADPRETSLRDDVMVRGSDKPHLEQDIDPEIQAEIDECTAYANALRDRGIGARAIKGVQREQGHRIVGVESAVPVLTERITELERNNRRLRDTASDERNENRGNEDGGNEENGNGGNRGNGNKDRGNGENENGNRNRNHGMNYGGFMPV
nr:hypothetical protein [Tanacetum cinerariifolium]